MHCCRWLVDGAPREDDDGIDDNVDVGDGDCDDDDHGHHDDDI